jgi:hypothetical protein
MKTSVYKCAPVLALLLIVGIAVPAAAATRTPPVSYGTSCIDGNVNGVCGDSADTPLAQALDSNTMYLDSQHGSHSGLVLQGGVHLPAFIYVQVTKNIVISGSVSEAGDDLGGTLETVHGNIIVRSGSEFSLRSSLSLNAYDAASTIDIGAGSKATVSGDMVDLSYHSYGTVHVGSNQNDTISGGGCANINFVGNNGLSVDPNQTFKGPNHGAYEMAGGSDLTLDHVNWNAGYVLINLIPSNAHSGAPNLVVTNSTLVQKYKNGNMHIYADTNLLGTIRVDHSTLVAKDLDGAAIIPSATCVASAAPPGACS